MNKTLMWLSISWVAIGLIAIIFKIKMFAEIFPIVGIVFVIFLLVFSIKFILGKEVKKDIDKIEK